MILSKIRVSKLGSRDSGCSRLNGTDLLIKRIHLFCRGLTGFDLHLGILTNGYHANDALIKCISFQICLCWVRILNFVVGYV